MTEPDVVAAIEPIADLFDQLGIPYSVVGSVASSVYGIARSTLDADLVADLPAHLIDEVVDALQDRYYIDRDAVADAVRRRAMFNVIHLATILKVDIYILTDRPFDRQSHIRRRTMPLAEGEAARLFLVDTAEDVLIHKLEWYRAGGCVSDRQWGDLLGVLKMQGTALDLEYIRSWCAQLGLSDLLARALAEAGLG
jgi:hypothetical protein